MATLALTTKTTQTFDVKYLSIICYPSNTESEDGEPFTLPGMHPNGTYAAMIDVDTGTICDWPIGTVVMIDLKVVDRGTYTLSTADMDLVLILTNEYVPDILCPAGNGYGDYIRMDVTSDGKIVNWKPELINDMVSDD